MKNKKTLTPFQEEALAYDKHIVLTANAGSGKTFVFAKRFVNIALKENPELDKLVAITFTEKAAGELYSSIVKEVSEKREELKGDKEAIGKLNKIRKRLVSAKISTIHSFCIDLLHDFSPEAGIDANFTPLDPAVAESYREKSFDELYSELVKTESPLLKYLMRYFGSKTMMWKALSRASGKRDTVKKISEEFIEKGVYSSEKVKQKFDKLFGDIIPPILNSFVEDLSEANESLLAEKPGNKAANSVRLLIERIKKKEDYFEKLRFLNSEEFKGTIFTKKSEIKKAVHSKEFDGETISRINAYAKLLLNFGYENKYEHVNELAEFAEKFLAFYSMFDEKYSEKKYQNGYLDFDDILLTAEKIVKEKSVLEKLKNKYLYIMIDEYQDTNELQYDIFIPILDELRAGNLFVVGDEKQSIYRFNSAELEVFRQTKKEVLAHQGEKLELPHSFRLAPNIALFTNKVFSRLFANPNPLYNEVEFSELASVRKEEEKGEVKFILTKKEDGAPTEAELIARKIIEITKNSELDFGDITILFRKNKEIEELEKTLGHFNIPYSVVGGRGYFQQLVVGDIHNYLSFLLSQNNDAALLGTLRAPFYSFPDSLILNIHSEKGKTLWEKVKSYSAKSPFVKDAVELIKKHIVISVTSDVGNLLSQILDDTAYWSVIASKKNAKQEIANTKKLLRFSVESITSETTSLYDFTQKLGTAIKETTDEGFAQLGEESKSVKLLTIHKSKGLEFDTVFLYNSNDSLNTSSVSSKSVILDKEFGVITKVPEKGNYFSEYKLPAIGWLYNYYDNRKESAEAKRLLYVAVTRAINSLYITASLGKNDSISANSFMNMFAESLHADLTSDKILIRESLPFIDLEKNIVDRRTIDFEIEILKEVEQSGTSEKSFSEENEFDLLLEKINDTETEEIISATKITLYKECPLKYHLTYNLGLGELNNLLKEKPELEFGKEELENIEKSEKIPSNVAGQILHKLLELETTPETLEKNFADVSESILGKEKSKKIDIQISDKIKEILNGYFSSEVYGWVKSKNNFKNEFEIYSKVSDYYLYGIIDKIIFEEEKKKIIIVDYKSDNVKEKEIQRKFNHYLTQLKLYALLAQSLFDRTENFELRLIFLKAPLIELKKEMTADEIISFKEEVQAIVENIRNSVFPKNPEACKFCHFAIAGRCVVD